MTNILILDFGSQYTHLIKANLGKTGFNSEIVPGDEKLSNWVSKNNLKNLKGIILSGGASSVYDGTIEFDKSWLGTGIPVLGICYGHQLIIGESGGSVEKHTAEFGHSTLNILCDSPLFFDIPKKINVWMSHRDTVTNLPTGYTTIASSDYSKIAAYSDEKRKFYGVQFHPEVSHTDNGAKMLENFCIKVCGIEKGEPWSAKDFIEASCNKIKDFVQDSNVIFGLSGGVDSLTTAVLLRKSLPKEKLLAVYVDSGLMPDETLLEVRGFCQDQDIQLLENESSEEFFKVLEGVTDPTLKGKAIGKKFIDVFENIAKNQKADVFAQGTIWSDVVESGVTKFSSQIKPHHNVGGLPERLNFKLLEPLRELFKDQVREVASELCLPDWVVRKKVFPGPGFAIRVQGVVTPEKVKLVRQATKIIEDIIYESEIRNDIWMAFAILVDVPSLGVRGDERTENSHAIVVRAVESKNSMTAEFSRKVFPYLSEISKRITDELEIGRVVYDITDKPPATIEWQ
jgi:GMP synthase (glutamine-hydrolysing)